MFPFDQSGVSEGAPRKTRFLVYFAALLVIVLAAATATGARAFAQSQGAAAAGQTIFSGGVNEVIVPVTATDSKGKFISDLVQSDFHIFDEGREQKIDYFSHEQSQPIVIGFLIDTSNSMKESSGNATRSPPSELMLSLLPGDKKYAGYLITYGTAA